MKGAESEKDCSGRANTGWESDEIIQRRGSENRQTRRQTDLCHGDSGLLLNQRLMASFCSAAQSRHTHDLMSIILMILIIVTRNNLIYGDANN